MMWWTCAGWAGPPDVLVCDGERGLGASEISTEKLLAGKTILQHQVTGRTATSVVSYEVAREPKGRLGILPATRVCGQRMKVHGELVEHGEIFVRKWWTKETSWQDVLLFGRPREKLWKNMPFPKRVRRAAATRSRPMKTFEPGTLCFFPRKRAETAQGGRYFGPAALIGPHGRSSWWVMFGGRADLCATEHLRGVTLDESDRLGIDERRQPRRYPKTTRT